MNEDTFLTAPAKNFESIKKIDENGFEYWEARELMDVLGYEEWRKFQGVMEKAKEACSSSGQKIANHFVGTDKMMRIAVGTSKETERKIIDYKLSRYACYLIAQNGDARKQKIALAQTYFAIQTRRQEIFQQLPENQQRLFLRGEVRVHNKALNATAAQAGVKNFGKFNNAGYLGLYGMNKASVQKKKDIGSDDVLDRAGATELAANLFRITQADEKLKREKIKGEGRATFAHIVVGQKVRKSIEDIGGTMPEDLSPELHIKRIEKDQKKSLATNLLEVVVYVHIQNKKLLLVRSKGKNVFYMPGGKRNEQENDKAALLRELKEELAIELLGDSLNHLGTFGAQAYGKPKDVIVRIICYSGKHSGDIIPSSEIVEAKFFSHSEYLAEQEIAQAARKILDYLKEKGLIE